MACDPNTLIANGKAFQALSEQQQMICICQLLCDISAGGGGGTGSVLFGDPGGATVAGKVAYDSNGNFWIIDDPSGAATPVKIITAEAPAPMLNRLAAGAGAMRVAAIEVPAAANIAQPMLAPQAARGKWLSKVQSVSNRLSLWVGMMLH